MPGLKSIHISKMTPGILYHIMLLQFSNYYHSDQINAGIHHIDSLAQDCSNSSALAMELLQSWAKTSIYAYAPIDNATIGYLFIFSSFHM